MEAFVVDQPFEELGKNDCTASVEQLKLVIDETVAVSAPPKDNNKIGICYGSSVIVGKKMSEENFPAAPMKWIFVNKYQTSYKLTYIHTYLKVEFPENNFIVELPQFNQS